MKITKLRRGYRISVSDVEFGLLSHIVDEGVGAIEINGIDAMASNKLETAAWEKRTKDGFFFRVDEARIRK